MICPHCLVAFNPIDNHENLIGKDSEGYWYYYRVNCPECKNIIIYLILWKTGSNLKGTTIPLPSGLPPHAELKKILVYPKNISRTPCPSEVDPKYQEDYKEACLVLADSPKASAALSRRCLQLLLRDFVGARKGNLQSEIEEAIEKEKYPTSISDLLHALQWIGNFAAHPEKSDKSQEIIIVEPGEAELCLEIIEALFDYHFVMPARNQARKDAINKKLTDAGKREI